MNIWKEEIVSLKMISELDLFTPKYICSLNDTQMKLENKYIVMEWIEGDSLKYLSKNRLFEKKFSAKFENEKDFVRMMFLLFHQIKIIHQEQIIHRDIKLDNIMYLERDSQLYFSIIDFGSSHKLSSKKSKIPTFSPGYSPPEQNTEFECLKSDIFSLSVTFSKLLLINKEIKIGNKLSLLLEKMISSNIEKRPSIDQCILQLTDYCESCLFSQNLKEYSLFAQSLIIPEFSSNYESLKESFRKNRMNLFFSGDIKLEKDLGKSQDLIKGFSKEYKEFTEEKEKLVNQIKQISQKNDTLNQEIQLITNENEKMRIEMEIMKVKLQLYESKN